MHINFFVSLALNCVANVLWYAAVHYDLLVNPDSNTTVLHRNPVGFCAYVRNLRYLTALWRLECDGNGNDALPSYAAAPAAEAASRADAPVRGHVDKAFTPSKLLN